MKIDKLEHDLETQKIRSRHFEGISKIAMIELQKGSWVNAIEKSRKVSNLLVDFQSELKHFEAVKADMVNCVSNLDKIVCSINAIFNNL